MSIAWSERDVSDWSLAGEETQGLHPHRWYSHSSEARTWLFKPARLERERSIGEDVAERLAYAIAGVLGVPAARVELARLGGVHGVLVEDARWPGGSLQHGQVLLSEVNELADSDDRENTGHSVVAIQAALGRFEPPPGSDLPQSFEGFDAFVGYLVFDALVAHVDRHDRNWAVLVRRPGDLGKDALCASFDHAACLGFTLTPDSESRHLRNGTVADWAMQGRASRFERRRGTRWASLVDVAGAAAGLCESNVRTWWHDRVEAIDVQAVTDLVMVAPRLSGATREFIIELVMVNRGRLLDVLT